MPNSFYDTIVILFFTVLPLTFILLQVFLSTRKGMGWGFLMPLLWSALGAWMMITSFRNEGRLVKEMLIFFLGGDLILFGIFAFIRNRKKKKS